MYFVHNVLLYDNNNNYYYYYNATAQVGMTNVASDTECLWYRNDDQIWIKVNSIKNVGLPLTLMA